MNSGGIGLFASGPVGFAIAETFRQEAHPLLCLVLDTADRTGANEKIRSVAPTDVVLEHAALKEGNGIDILRELGPDLAVLAWWPYIIDKELLPIPQWGWVNMHPSLLPHNRGKDPNFWAIVEGAPFGVTLHLIDEGVDSGPILFQRRIPVTWEDTGGSLYRKATHEIVELFREHFDEIVDGQFDPQTQSLSTGSYHTRSELEPASSIHIDEEYRARDLLNLMRARTFPPHPGVRFQDQGRIYEVRIDIRERSDET